MRALLLISVMAIALWMSSGCDRPASAKEGSKPAGDKPATTQSSKIVKTEEEWKKILTPEQFRILRQKGTERAFTGKYWNNHELGVYVCAGCNTELFVSDTKFDSGCGWPSFFQPVAADRIKEQVDTSHGMVRTEVMCAKCEGHLGHVFNDGPKDKTGLRYCINSESMHFIKAEVKEEKK